MSEKYKNDAVDAAIDNADSVTEIVTIVVSALRFVFQPPFIAISLVVIVGVIVRLL